MHTLPGPLTRPPLVSCCALSTPGNPAPAPTSGAAAAAAATAKLQTASSPPPHPPCCRPCLPPTPSPPLCCRQARPVLLTDQPPHHTHTHLPPLHTHTHTFYFAGKPAKSEDEVKTWDTEFCKVDQGTLFELILVSFLSFKMHHSLLSWIYPGKWPCDTEFARWTRAPCSSSS